MIGSAGVLTTLAPAKVNLTLRILGRRADGFHDLESMVVFAPFGDRLALRVGPQLGLTVSGPTASGAGPLADNLVLRAAQALAARIDGLKLGRFTLTKRLPAGAGLGGGSSDAAAALRLIAQANGLGPDEEAVRAAARAAGADVPVCLDPQPRLMRGTGDILSAPLALPTLGIVIVHPWVAVPTGQVFTALGLTPGERRAAPPDATPWTAGTPPAPSPPSPACGGGKGGGTGVRPARGPWADAAGDEREALFDWLAGRSNDLEAAAIAIAPEIADVLGALASLPGCRLSRMSGSGSACFGLFDAARPATGAARRLALARPDWWVRAGRFGN